MASGEKLCGLRSPEDLGGRLVEHAEGLELVFERLQVQVSAAFQPFRQSNTPLLRGVPASRQANPFLFLG
jgi:hypothetical protein